MIAMLDRFSLFAMGAGVAMMLQPWWEDGFRVGFFAALAATALQIIVGHMVKS